MIKSFMIIRNFFVNFLSDMFYHLINGKKHYESFNERKRHDYRSVTLKEAANLLGISSQRKVYKYVYQGKLKERPDENGHFGIDLKSIQDFLTKQRMEEFLMEFRKTNYKRVYVVERSFSVCSPRPGKSITCKELLELLRIGSNHKAQDEQLHIMQKDNNHNNSETHTE